jgi:peptide/nickel transport system substrate-binding protein
MLRGFRWQLFALLTAAVLFAAVLIIRLTTIMPSPDTTPTPGVIAVTATSSPIPQPSLTPTPAPTFDFQAVGSPPPDEVITFREGVIGNVQRLNPLYADLNPVDQDITSLIFEGLTRMDARGQIVPGLAERWQISTDGLEYVFYLRQGVAWHDGIPFTSADVVYTMAILRDPAFTGSSARATFWRTVETEALDTFIVRFRITQPLGTFLDRLRIGLLPEHALRGTHAAELALHPFNLNPIGTGAYQIESVRTAFGRVRGIDLRVAPVFRARPEGQSQAYALERVRFTLYDDFDSAVRAFASGEIDALAGRDRNERRALFDIANRNGLQLVNGFEPTVGTLIFNWGREATRFFRDQRVRVGLDTGLDRSVLVERTLINMALRADSFIVPSFWAYAANVPRPVYNAPIAAQLLQTARERLGDPVTPTPEAPISDATLDPAFTPTPTPPPSLFTFTIMTPNDPALIALTNEIAQQWGRLGLLISVESVDVTTYRARLESGDFDAALIEYSFADGADPDLYAFWHQGQYPDGLNYGSADDRRISEILERARREPYGVNRAREYAEFQRVFADRALALPLYYPLYTYGTARQIDGIQLGFLSAAPDRFITIGDWAKR